MHASQPAHRKATLWLAAIVGCLALLLATPALSQAEESNPNNYNCLGSLAAGTPEEGSEEQQVKYSFYCNGPITGYQLQSQVPLTGIQSPPLVTDLATQRRTPLKDTFSCSGEVPGYAVNCVGVAKGGYETITRPVRDRHEALRRAARGRAADGHLRLPRKRRRHAGDLRPVRPRPPERLPARRALGRHAAEPEAADQDPQEAQAQSKKHSARRRRPRRPRRRR